jgi:hypothetical protein
VIDLARENEVFTLRMNDAENRLRADSVTAWNAARDEAIA